MTIAEFDALEISAKRELLHQCCNCDAWIKSMLTVFPVNDLVDLLEYAEEKWFECNAAEWLEVFQGYTTDFEQAKYQLPVISSASVVLNFSPEQNEELQSNTLAYQNSFGYNFIIFVQGRTANEILTSLKSRLRNDPNDELLITAGEQNRINQSKLQKIFTQ